MIHLYTLERSLDAPQGYAAAWLQGRADAPATWVVERAGIRASHRVEPRGEGSLLRIEVEAKSRLARLAKPALVFAMRARSARLARDMAKDWRGGAPPE